MTKEQIERINVLKSKESKNTLTEYERIELQVISNKLYKPIKQI